MTAQEFEEVVMTLIYTYGVSKTDIAKILKVKPIWITRWLKDGVPKHNAVMVRFRLRKFVRNGGVRNDS